MSMNPIVERALFAVLMALTLGAALVRPRWFLFMLGLTIPLMTPRLDVGIGLDWYKIVGPLAILLSVLNRRGAIGVRKSQASWMLTYAGYALVVTSVWMFVEYSFLQRYRLAAAMEMGGGIAQNMLKMPVQLGSVLGQVSAVLAVPLWANSLRDCRAAIFGVVSGVVLSVAAGLAGWALFGVATINISGPGGVVVYNDYTLSRLGGLSGEPKFLAVSIAIVLAYALSLDVFSSGQRRVTWAVVLLLGVLFLTVSTSGIGAAAAAIAAVCLLALTNPGRGKLGTLVALVACGVIVVTGVGLVSAILENRVVERLFGDSGDLDQQKDMYVFRIFSDEPANVFFGYGLGGTDLAVIPYVEWIHLKYKRTPTPGVTVVRLLGDLGIIGLVLLSAIAAAWARTLKRDRDFVGASFVMAGLAAAMLGSLIGITLYLFIAGAVLSAAALRRDGVVT